MQRAFKKTNVVVLLAAMLAACALAPHGAKASTGGASAGSGSATSAAPLLPRRKHGVYVATWFGPGFYGQRTACGQMLTPAVVGVANRTLRCGTLVNLSYRGRHLIVPVIDRGPYANGADWDLTGEAARALGIQDTVRVRARVVGSVPNTPTLGLPPASQQLAATGGASAS
jgi:rare lipoprotein A (peptidoglycan hydrolase)